MPSRRRRRFVSGLLSQYRRSRARQYERARRWRLEQVIQTLDSTLVDELNGTRKFDVVTRKAALEAIMEEQDLGGSGNIDPVTAAKIMKWQGHSIC